MDGGGEAREATVLRVVTGAGEATVPAGRPFVIGRARTADFVIPDSRVSRRHLLIEQFGSAWNIRDISSNGTWVDGRRMQSMDVHGEARLRLGTPTGPEVLVLPEQANGDGEMDTEGDPPVRVGRREPANGGGDTDPGTFVPPPRVAPPVDLPSMFDDPAGYKIKETGWFRTGPSAGMTSLDQMHERRTAYRIQAGAMSIGRARNNAIVISDLLAARHHAELHVSTSGVEIVDLDSANGTFVNGQRITRALVDQGAVIAVGHHIFQLEGDELVEYIDSGDVAFEADGLNVFVGGDLQIMHDMTFRLPGRALLGVVGPSGSGKSTLLNALTGFRPADSGFVRYAGRDMYSEYDELRRRIGYVPQEDLLHTSLTVRTALEYGARLRFPPDTTKAERRTRVDEVLDELGLAQRANTQVSRLSGGQRKRASVALELLTRPTLLYLDEPTSGLDPGMDKSVMESLRKLADDGRTVVVVTHSVAQLDLCDYVLVLAPGGYVAYFGPPQDALSFFGKKDYPDVFLMLEATPGRESAAKFRQSRYYVPASVTAPSARPAPEDLPNIRQQSVFSQLATLSRRTMAVVASNRPYLWFVVALPFLLGLIPRAIPGDVTLPAPGVPNSDAPTILLVMAMCACIMGMANAVREIVRERAIYRRERAIGLSGVAYLGSKIAVLAVITTLQAIPFTLIALVGREPPDSVLLGNSLAECYLAVVVMALSSAMLGLVISALVDNADRVVVLAVLAMTAQLLFSGGIVPVEGRPGLEQASMFVPARWGYAALASTSDLNAITLAGVPHPLDSTILANPKVVEDPLFAHTSATYLLDIGAGVGIGVACVIATALLIRRMDPKRAKRRPARAW